MRALFWSVLRVCSLDGTEDQGPTAEISDRTGIDMFFNDHGREPFSGEEKVPGRNRPWW